MGVEIECASDAVAVEDGPPVVLIQTRVAPENDTSQGEILNGLIEKC